MIALLTWITIGWAAVLLSSLVSMMAVFMGSGSGDLAGLLNLQIWLIPLQVVAILAYALRARQLSPESSGLTALWRATPGWLVFAVLSAASLVLIAELSFLLITLLAEHSRPWIEHVPAMTAMLSALALAMGYAQLRIEETADVRATGD